MMPPHERRAEDKVVKSQFDRLWKRITMGLAVLGLVETAFIAFAGRIQWPRDTIAAIETRVTAIEGASSVLQAQVVQQKSRVDSSLALGRSNLKLLCILIARVNPRGSVPPPECLSHDDTNGPTGQH